MATAIRIATMTIAVSSSNSVNPFAIQARGQGIAFIARLLLLMALRLCTQFTRLPITSVWLFVALVAAPELVWVMRYSALLSHFWPEFKNHGIPVPLSWTPSAPTEPLLVLTWKNPATVEGVPLVL